MLQLLFTSTGPHPFTTRVCNEYTFFNFLHAHTQVVDSSDVVIQVRLQCSTIWKLIIILLDFNIDCKPSTAMGSKVRLPIQVLDARDPIGTRSKHIEWYLRKEKPHKHLILVLNKCDLVPTWVTVSTCIQTFCYSKKGRFQWHSYNWAYLGLFPC